VTNIKIVKNYYFHRGTLLGFKCLNKFVVKKTNKEIPVETLLYDLINVSRAAESVTLTAAVFFSRAKLPRERRPFRQ